MLKKLAQINDVNLNYLLTGSSSEIERYDLYEILKKKNLTWNGVELDEDEKEKAFEILNILFKRS
jgi:hypothetical protein